MPKKDLEVVDMSLKTRRENFTISLRRKNLHKELAGIRMRKCQMIKCQGQPQIALSTDQIRQRREEIQLLISKIKTIESFFKQADSLRELIENVSNDEQLFEAMLDLFFLDMCIEGLERLCNQTSDNEIPHDQQKSATMLILSVFTCFLGWNFERVRLATLKITDLVIQVALNSDDCQVIGLACLFFSNLIIDCVVDFPNKDLFMYIAYEMIPNLEKRLSIIIYKQVNKSPYDWCFLNGVISLYEQLANYTTIKFVFKEVS